MTRLPDLDTPAALVDTARMRRNIARMQDRMNALGVAFRPHVKTSKSLLAAPILVAIVPSARTAATHGEQAFLTAAPP